MVFVLFATLPLRGCAAGYVSVPCGDARLFRRRGPAIGEPHREGEGNSSSVSPQLLRVWSPPMSPSDSRPCSFRRAFAGQRFDRLSRRLELRAAARGACAERDLPDERRGVRAERHADRRRCGVRGDDELSSVRGYPKPLEFLDLVDAMTTELFPKDVTELRRRSGGARLGKPLSRPVR